jgi:type II secretion system protein G
MSEITGRQCVQCGAGVAPGRRYCLVCQLPVPDTAPLLEIPTGQTEQAGQSSQRADIIPSKHRPDKTLVFVPERREARLRRKRRNRRILISALIGCAILIVLSVTFWRAAEQKQALARQQRRELMARGELDRFARSLDFFYDDVGRYPTDKEGLAALITRPAAVANWHGPYIDGDYSVDPWGNDYIYKTYDDGVGYELFSYGPDGEEGKKVFLQVNSSGQSATPNSDDN